MGVGEDFKTFCSNLAVTNRETIARRYAAITKRLNLDFWNIDSETYHSFYTGSYGRGTAIGGTSDADMIFRLPDKLYEKYNSYSSNGQSAMLQDVRVSIKKTYFATDIGADGQVVIVPFDDGITFEVVPAFLNKDGSYTFPDSNEGGKWRITNPKPEIDEVVRMDLLCNGNLKNLCKMARAWKRTWNVPMGGLLIDTLAYYFIRDYEYKDKSFLYYDFMSRDFFEFLSKQNEKQEYWLSPRASQYVWRTGSFEYKATRCKNIAIDAIAHDSEGQTYSARKSWREIYGSAYPS